MSTLMKNDKTIAGLASGMKLLWENPNPTSAFANQTITLNSADYDFLFLSCILYGQDNTSVSTIGEKGHGLYIEAEWYTQGSVHIRQRAFTYVSTTQFAVSDGLIDGVADNLSLIPVAIYGIKL